MELNNRILLFHGSSEIVKQPEIRIYPNHAMDFGQGFYCTTSRYQADKWARAKIRTGKIQKGYVNEFAFLLKDKNLRIKQFDREPSIEWLDFVVANRTNPLLQHPYDIVIGPIADDDAFSEIEKYVAGKDYSVQRKLELIKTLKTYKLKDQLLFHTKESLTTLQFLGFKEVKNLKPIQFGIIKRKR